MDAAVTADQNIAGQAATSRADLWTRRAMLAGLVVFLAANLTDAGTAAMVPVSILSRYDLNPLERALAPALGPLLSGLLIKGMSGVFALGPCAFIWRVGGRWARTAVAAIFWAGAAAGFFAAYMNFVNGIMA